MAEGLRSAAPAPCGTQTLVKLPIFSWLKKSKETKTKLYKIGEIRQYKHGTGVNFFYSENSAISLNILESLGKGVKEAI